MANFAPDPFTQVYNALWAALNAQPEFVKYVKPGNQINMQIGNSLENQLKKNVQNSDAPEVSILQAGGPFKWISSDTVTIDKTYRIGLWTSDVKPNANLNPAEFAVLCAIASMDSNFGLPFVLEVKNVTATDMLKATRGTDSWSNLTTLVVTFKFNRAQLKGTA